MDISLCNVHVNSVGHKTNREHCFNVIIAWSLHHLQHACNIHTHNYCIRLNSYYDLSMQATCVCFLYACMPVSIDLLHISDIRGVMYMAYIHIYVQQSDQREGLRQFKTRYLCLYTVIYSVETNYIIYQLLLRLETYLIKIRMFNHFVT